VALRGAGVSASVAANASARWRTPGGTCGGRDRAADLFPGLRRGLVGAHGGEAVDEYGEIGGPVGGAVVRPAAPVHLRCRRTCSATVTLRIVLIDRMLHADRAIRQRQEPNGSHTAPVGHSVE
jgi:hypothetical protein